MNEDSMPSKRMVPEQEVSDAGEDLVRLAAAKDAEIAALEARELDQCPACFWHPGHEPDEWFREEKELRSAALAKMRAEIAALTEQRDEQMALADSVQEAMAKTHAPYWPLSIQEHVAKVTEQRDRAMKDAVIAWSVCASLHREFGKGRDAIYATRQADFVKHEADARAALDAEAAAETAPSLPETP